MKRVLVFLGLKIAEIGGFLGVIVGFIWGLDWLMDHNFAWIIITFLIFLILLALSILIPENWKRAGEICKKK